MCSGWSRSIARISSRASTVNGRPLATASSIRTQRSAALSLSRSSAFLFGLTTRRVKARTILGTVPAACVGSNRQPSIEPRTHRARGSHEALALNASHLPRVLQASVCLRRAWPQDTSPSNIRNGQPRFLGGSLWDPSSLGEFSEITTFPLTRRPPRIICERWHLAHRRHTRLSRGIGGTHLNDLGIGGRIAVMHQRSLRQSRPSTDFNPPRPAQPALVEPGEPVLTSSAQSADANRPEPRHRMSALDMLVEGGHAFGEFLAKTEAEETAYRQRTKEAADRNNEQALRAEEQELAAGLTPRHLAFAAASIQAQAEGAARWKESAAEKRQARQDVWAPLCHHFGINPIAATLSDFIGALNHWDRRADPARIKGAMRRIRQLAERHALATEQEVPRTERGPKRVGKCVLSLFLPNEGTRQGHRITRETLRDGIPGGPSADQVKDIILDIFGEDGLKEVLDHSAREGVGVNR
jgi:hypothetical protein